MEKQYFIPALKIKFYNKIPSYRYADTVLPNCISCFQSLILVYYMYIFAYYEV